MSIQMPYLPYEVSDKIFSYVRTSIPIINKHDLKQKREIYVDKINIIKRWYKKNKIESQMPILFLSEMENFDKWYIIRLYMKFYPKLDLYDWPIYYLKRFNNIPNMVSDYGSHIEDNIVNYRYSTKAYNVFKFMQKISKNDIIKTGF